MPVLMNAATARKISAGTTNDAWLELGNSSHVIVKMIAGNPAIMSATTAEP